VFKITHSAVNCSELLEGNQGFTLNYPSIAVAVNGNGSDSSTVVLRRTVINVGAPNSTYTALVAGPVGVNVTVDPTTLAFTKFGEKKSFEVWVDASAAGKKDSADGYLVWKQQSGGQGRRRTVRSPIAVTWPVE
jgi:hypothetical protein